MNTTKDESAPVVTMEIIGDFLFKPYTNRVKLGEGGLVIFNIVHSLYTHQEAKLTLLECILSFFVMCALYGYNDYSDRQKDIHNDKKDKKFIAAIIQNERLFIILNILLTITTAIGALFLHNPDKVIILCLLYSVNFLYSKSFKSLPVIDLFIVALWGGLYVMISGRVNYTLALIVGVMTGIAHLFQMITDKVSDKQNNIRTTVVSIPGAETFFLAIICLILGCLLWKTLSIWWALTCFFPILLFRMTSITVAWYISRVYFFVCWVQLLNTVYGGF